jgi:acetylornithine deacetylase/succinyl-diaminopimelate desuccinylase family protein
MADKVMESGDLKDLVQKTVNSYELEIVEFTKTLIAIQTENPPGRFYRECCQVISSKMQELGLDYKIIEVPSQESFGSENIAPGVAGAARAGFGDAGAGGSDGFASGSRGERSARCCLLAYYGRGERTLYFHGHYDVVPASDQRQFAPRVKNGTIIGRGSSDMKGGLASMIYAVKALKACNVPLAGRICLAIVPDEETGGALGSQFLGRNGVLGEDGIGMITAEPTSGAIWNGSRGAISLRVTVVGKPAHVGLHYKGVNAFEQMLKVALALLELKSEVESRKTELSISPDDARRSILMIGGRSDGGTSFNVVPGKCSFTVDRRINPEESLEEEKNKLFAVFDAFRDKGIDIRVEVLQEGEPTGSSETTPLAVALAESVGKVRGGSPSIEMCPGLLETRFYARLGLPALAYGPGILSVSHGPDEFVKVEDLRDCAVVYALTAAKILTV